MADLYAHRTITVNSECTWRGMDASGAGRENVRVAKDAEIFLREWRDFRGLTQEVLAELAGTTHATVSRIESGKIKPSMRMLNQLASALGTEVALLLLRPPREGDAIMTVREVDKPKLEAYAKGLLDGGADKPDNVVPIETAKRRKPSSKNKPAPKRRPEAAKSE